MEEHDHIQLRSEEIQEILGTPPSWIVRWGSVWAFIIILFLVFISYLIKYPEVIPASIVITTAVPPESVIAKADAQLEEILVEDREFVESQQLLAIMQSAANYQDVELLDEEVFYLQGMDENEILRYSPKRGLILGQLQADYSNFIQDFEQYLFNRESGFDKNTIRQLQTQKRNLEQSIRFEQAKYNDAQEELKLEKQTQQRIKNLYPKVSTKQDMEDARAAVVKKQREVKSHETNMLNYQLELDRIEEQILSVRQDASETLANQFVRLKETINRLKSSIDRWKQTYLIRAPIAGQVNYAEFGRKNQFVKIGEEVMAIVPEQGDSIMGKMYLPIRGSGKVETSQKVIVKFESYPYQEYGVVIGEVKKKSLLPQGKEYLVEVGLPNLEDGKVMTSHGKALTFTQEMQGQAEIITEDRRFIERIFDKFLAIFDDY